MTAEPGRDELKERVLAAVRATPSPPRAQTRSRSSALLVSAAVVPLLGFVAIGGFESGSRPPALIALTGAGISAIALVSLWLALGTGGRMLGRARLWLGAQALLAPLFFLGWKLWSSAAFVGMTEPTAERPGLRCLGLTLLLGSWPLLAFSLVRRRSDPTHPRMLGAALGVAAGSYAATLVDFWCPVGYPPHVLLGHILPLVALGLVGAWLGHRLLALPR